MTDELSRGARAMLERALADEWELTPGAGKRHQLKRALLQAAAVSGAGSASLAKAALLEGSRTAGTLAGSAPFFSLAKGVAVGLLLSGSLIGGAHVLSTSPPPTRSSAAPRASAPSRSELRAAPSNAPPIEEPVVAKAPPAPTAPPPLPAKPPVSGPSGSADPALRAELALMTAAQAALRDGKAWQALRLLERYDAEFPGGQLSRERLAAEVFGACQVGDRARAARAAKRFLQHDSDSALAQRVKQACPFTSNGVAP
jgi:hypothetical protein